MSNDDVTGFLFIFLEVKVKLKLFLVFCCKMTSISIVAGSGDGLDYLEYTGLIRRIT